jgi:hypothetical protein
MVDVKNLLQELDLLAKLPEFPAENCWFDELARQLDQLKLQLK